MPDLFAPNEVENIGASAPLAGAEPLSNVRGATCCQALSRAAPPSLVNAYFEATAAAGQRRPRPSTARVAASNLSRKKIIDERIAYLRQERLKGSDEAPEGLNERRIQELLRTCSETLVNAAKAADAAGLGASQVSAIRKSIIVHEGRRTRSERHVANVSPPVPEITLNVPDWCTCAVGKK